MANDVFANGREVSCKKADGKSICAFPDVCFTPPENPATPPGVPVPYPNTGMAKDMTSGSKSVKITGQEVMLKNKSYFKKSYGDEAGCAAKKGIITSVNRGKVYFISWSMDVKFEGENVVRHLDMTTHNHASPITNTMTWTYLDRMEMALGIEECNEAASNAYKKCGPLEEKIKCPSSEKVKLAEKSREWAKEMYGDDSAEYDITNKRVKNEYSKYSKEVEQNDCQKALRCFLSPYEPSRCCDKQTPHHVIDAASFLDEGVRYKFGEKYYDNGKRNDKKLRREHRRRKKGWKKYEVNKAPCVCTEGPNQCTATHGEVHARTSVRAECLAKNGKWTRKQATIAGVKSINDTFPNTENCKKCLYKQIKKYHDNAKTSKDEQPIDATTQGDPKLKEKFRRPNTRIKR